VKSPAVLVDCKDLPPFRRFIVRNEAALITQDFGRQVKVSGFDGTKSDDAKTVTGVLGYVDPGTGDKYMLVVHQAILVPKMTVNLLGLMQLQDNELKVKDRDRMRIPLWIKGVTTTWKPTWQDFEGVPFG